MGSVWTSRVIVFSFSRNRRRAFLIRFPEGILATFRDEMQAFLQVSPTILAADQKGVKYGNLTSQDAVDVFPDPGQLYPDGTPAVPIEHLQKFRTGMASLLEVSDGDVQCPVHLIRPPPARWDRIKRHLAY